MIYTSYFAKLKKMPSNFHPVGITLYPPKWYDGPNYRGLAPTKDTLFAYKKSDSVDESTVEKEYTESFLKETIGSKNPEREIEKAVSLLSPEVQDKIREDGIPIWESPSEHLVLMCFEKTGDFCHRNIVAKWMREHGIPVREATDEDFERTTCAEEIEK